MAITTGVNQGKCFQAIDAACGRLHATKVPGAVDCHYSSV